MPSPGMLQSTNFFKDRLDFLIARYVVADYSESWKRVEINY